MLSNNPHNLALTAANMVKVAGQYTQGDFEKEFINLPKGWGIIARTQDLPGSNPHLLKAAAYIHNETKTIIISNVGTHFEISKQGMYDIADDACIAVGEAPLKFKDIKAFVNQLIGLIGPDIAKEYNIITTGHSLGGVLADLTALYAKSKGLKVTDSITFDSPGSKKIIENILKTKEFNNLSLKDLKTEVNFETYTNNPNIVNCTDKQIGAHYYIVGENCSSVNKVLSKVDSALNTVKEANISFIDKAVGFIKSIGKKINNFTKVTDEHKLDNIISKLENQLVFKVSKNDWVNGDAVVKLDSKYLPLLTKQFGDQEGDIAIELEQDILPYKINEGTLLALYNSCVAYEAAANTDITDIAPQLLGDAIA